MGAFWALHHWGGGWHIVDGPEPSFSVSIHDSDIAAIEIRPTARGTTGRFYLGVQPREYWEDESANDPVDVAAEAAGLATWAQGVTGTVVDPAQLAELIAPEGLVEPLNVFVEETLGVLLERLGLPAPDFGALAGGPEAAAELRSILDACSDLLDACERAGLPTSQVESGRRVVADATRRLDGGDLSGFSAVREWASPIGELARAVHEVGCWPQFEGVLERTILLGTWIP